MRRIDPAKFKRKRDPFSPVSFKPFNGMVRVDNRDASVLKPSNKACIVDIFNHGPDGVLLVQRTNRYTSAPLAAGESRRGRVEADVAITARSNGYARLSVRYFRAAAQGA